MRPESAATKDPPVGILLIASFWFLLGSFGLVITMSFFRNYPTYMMIGLLISLGLIFEGWGLILARLWAMVIAFVFSLLFALVSLEIFIGIVQSLISGGLSGSSVLYDLVWISLPFMSLLMTGYLAKLFSQWGKEQSLSQPP